MKSVIQISLPVLLLVFTLMVSCLHCTSMPTNLSSPDIKSIHFLYGIPWTETGAILSTTDTLLTDSIDLHFTFNGFESWIRPVDSEMVWTSEPPVLIVGAVVGTNLSQTKIVFDGACTCCGSPDTVPYHDTNYTPIVWESHYGKYQFTRKSPSGKGHEEVAYFLLSFGRYGYNAFCGNDLNGIFVKIFDSNDKVLKGWESIAVHHYLYQHR